MAHFRMSRAERKDVIEGCLQQSNNDIHTVNSIAKMLGMKPSSYLRALLDELFIDNRIALKVVRYDDGQVAKRFYSHPDRVAENTDFHQFYFPF